MLKEQYIHNPRDEALEYTIFKIPVLHTQLKLRVMYCSLKSDYDPASGADNSFKHMPVLNSGYVRVAQNVAHEILDYTVGVALIVHSTHSISGILSIFKWIRLFSFS